MTGPSSGPSRSVLPTPRRTPLAVPLGVLVALGLLALAVALVRDLAVDQGWTGGAPWAPELADAVDGFEPSTVAVVAAYAVVAVGVLLVLAALGRGRATHVRAGTRLDAWVSMGAVAAAARTAADRAPGVLHAEVVRAGRRRVVVEVTSRPGEETSAARAAQAAATDALPELDGVRVAVRAARAGNGRDGADR
jgi:hypothetical protein